jgi:hypothetical protein
MKIINIQGPGSFCVMPAPACAGQALNEKSLRSLIKSGCASAITMMIK